MTKEDRAYIDRLNKLCARAPQDLLGAELTFSVNEGDDVMHMRLGCAHLQRDFAFSKLMVSSSFLGLDCITSYYNLLVDDLRKALQFAAQTPAND